MEEKIIMNIKENDCSVLKQIICIILIKSA